MRENARKLERGVTVVVKKEEKEWGGVGGGYNGQGGIFVGNYWNILLFCKSIFRVLFLFAD